MRWAAVLMTCLLAAPAFAQDIRPVARDGGERSQTDQNLRPALRPSDLTAAPTAPRSIVPRARPSSLVAAARQRRIAQIRGQVCGDADIQGENLGVVAGRGACGIDQGVRIRSVAGVTLRPAATIDCPTAKALKTWVEQGVLPAVGSEGGGVASLRVVSDYACRTRNNQSGTRLSEHAFGRAIDIAGIRLRDGSEMNLLRDWNSAGDGAQLRQMWRAACGPFGTVLGPEANRFHRDHFHFDTARYRRGTFCR